MTALSELLPLMTYCFVMSGTPGPNNVLLTAAGANFGYRGTVPQILGTNSGVAALTWLCCMGLGSVFVAYPVAHQVLRVVGSLYLVWLAWKLTGNVLVEHAGALRAMSFAEAVLFQVVNPKSWVKSITLASVFMPPGLDVAAGALVVACVGFAIGFPCSSVWALFGVAIRGFLRDPRQQGRFNLLMGGTLVVLSLVLLIKA